MMVSNDTLLNIEFRYDVMQIPDSYPDIRHVMSEKLRHQWYKLMLPVLKIDLTDEDIILLTVDNRVANLGNDISTG